MKEWREEQKKRTERTKTTKTSQQEANERARIRANAHSHGTSPRWFISVKLLFCLGWVTAIFLKILLLCLIEKEIHTHYIHIERAGRAHKITQMSDLRTRAQVAFLILLLFLFLVTRALLFVIVVVNVLSYFSLLHTSRSQFFPLEFIIFLQFAFDNEIIPTEQKRNNVLTVFGCPLLCLAVVLFYMPFAELLCFLLTLHLQLTYAYHVSLSTFSISWRLFVMMRRIVLLAHDGRSNRGSWLWPWTDGGGGSVAWLLICITSGSKCAAWLLDG